MQTNVQWDNYCTLFFEGGFCVKCFISLDRSLKQQINYILLHLHTICLLVLFNFSRVLLRILLCMQFDKLRLQEINKFTKITCQNDMRFYCRASTGWQSHLVLLNLLFWPGSVFACSDRKSGVCTPPFMRHIPTVLCITVCGFCPGTKTISTNPVEQSSSDAKRRSASQ